ncbi:MAG: hypothetical protein IID41_06895 [Planctomycetes bacterium]|nr:hypothetical protein [Planctomycetota bacterium]
MSQTCNTAARAAPERLPARCWPRDDHPFANLLRLDPNFIWWRMMMSVAPAEALFVRGGAQ